MKNVRLIAAFVISAALVSLLSSCNKDDDDPVKIEITQEQLDAAVMELKIGQTGDDFPHGGPVSTGDSTFRDMYGSTKDLSGEITPGTIVAKRTYGFEDGGRSDQLYVTFAMVKREAGFDSENKDWEYIMMPYDASTDYSKHPNGILPAVGADNRGANVGQCKICHSSAPGGDYLYVNDL